MIMALDTITARITRRVEAVRTPRNDDPKRYGWVRFGAPLTVTQRGFRVLARAGFGAFARPYFDLNLVGEAKLPKTGPVVIAANHRSNIDTPIVGVAMHRYYRYIAKGSMYTNPLFSWVLVALGGFPVRRGSADRRTLDNAKAILEAGEGLFVFAEGARQDGPRVMPLFEGAVFIAARAGVPIYPLGIGGTAKAMPIGAKFPQRHAIAIVVGDPLEPPRPEPGARRVSRAQMEAFSHDLRERIQAVFDEAQDLAGSPNGPWPAESELVRREPWA